MGAGSCGPGRGASFAPLGRSVGSLERALHLFWSEVGGGGLRTWAAGGGVECGMASGRDAKCLGGFGVALGVD